MARIINHPLGELSGKVGAVVFKKTKYGSYLSSVPSGPPPKASALQELQQSKMKAVMHFLTPLRVILKHTFFPLAQRTPTFNMIKSYYLRNAVTPSDVGYRMAYAKCLMSYGDLRIPEEVTANWNPGQPVQVSWNPQVTQAMAQADDVLLPWFISRKYISFILWNTWRTVRLHKLNLACLRCGVLTLNFIYGRVITARKNNRLR